MQTTKNFGKPLSINTITFSTIESQLMNFRDNFNLFSPHVYDTKGTVPIIANQKYEVSFIPILQPVPAEMLINFIKNEGGIFTGISGLLNFHHKHQELFLRHRGMYIVSMMNHPDIKDFPRIAVPSCEKAKVNFGFHRVTTRNDFYNSTIALLFKEVS